MRLLLVFLLAFPACARAEVYLGNGIKIGEVDAASAIVWLRLTGAPERRMDGTPFQNDDTKVPDGRRLADMKDSLMGTAGKPAPWAMSAELARFKWNRLYSLENQRDFHRSFASYFMKDDHDTLKDDCWPGHGDFRDGRDHPNSRASWVRLNSHGCRRCGHSQPRSHLSFDLHPAKIHQGFIPESTPPLFLCASALNP